MTAQDTVALEPVDREVDARGLNCPLPILRTKTALNRMVTGQTLRILTTEPGSVRDFRAFCRQRGNELVGEGERDGALWFVIRRR
jgi:tRNA 2-thiouridine synthesizing protein A